MEKHTAYISKTKSHSEHHLFNDSAAQTDHYITNKQVHGRKWW